MYKRFANTDDNGGRILLVTRRSSAIPDPGNKASVVGPADDTETDQLLHWLPRNLTSPYRVTLVAANCRSGFGPLFKHAEDLRRRGFGTILAASLDRIGRCSEFAVMWDQLRLQEFESSFWISLLTGLRRNPQPDRDHTAIVVVTRECEPINMPERGSPALYLIRNNLLGGRSGR